MKKILIRGLILALIGLVIAFIGGIAPLDLPFLIIAGLLVLILAALMTIIHNRKDG